MLELGPDSPQMHREAGHEMGQLGIDVVWGVRGLAQDIVAGGRDAGVAETRFFADSNEAAVGGGR